MVVTIPTKNRKHWSYCQSQYATGRYAAEPALELRRWHRPRTQAYEEHRNHLTLKIQKNFVRRKSSLHTYFMLGIEVEAQTYILQWAPYTLASTLVLYLLTYLLYQYLWVDLSQNFSVYK